MRTRDNFINDLGVVLKRCIKCREKDKKRSQRPDIILKRKKNAKENQYYKKYREKKKTTDKNNYLQKASEQMKKWREKNKEHVSKMAANNFNTRLYSIKQQAQKKNIIWDQTLTDEYCYKMMISECFYCGIKTNEGLNGIDRLDNNGKYSLSNCVGCCKKCNFIKTALDPITFVKRCQHITKYLDFNSNGILNYEMWEDNNSKTTSFLNYKQRAFKKKLEFLLTEIEYKKFIYEKCYYCGKSPKNDNTNGIDRKNNKVGYILTNCVSCCKECNIMKKDLKDDEFIQCCKNVCEYVLNNSNIMEKLVLCNIETNKKTIVKRNKQTVIKEKITINYKPENNKKLEINTPEILEYIPKQRIYTRGSNLPINCSIKPEEIPDYCYYIQQNKIKGDGFCCGKLHPKHKETKINWTTTRSKKITINEKFKQLLAYLNNQEYIPLEELEIPKIIKPKIKKEFSITDKLNEKQIIDIMEYKSKNMTTQDVSNLLKNNYSIYINRNIISKIWKGEIEIPEKLKNTDIYNKMITNTKQRTKKSNMQFNENK